MDLTGADIEPAEGYIAVRFIDDDKDADDVPSASSGVVPGGSYSNDACLALIVAVGAKVKAKKGQVALLRPYARDGLKLGDGIVLVESYCIAGTVNG